MFALHFFQKLFYEVKKDADEVDKKMKEKEQEFDSTSKEQGNFPKKMSFLCNETTD